MKSSETIELVKTEEFAKRLDVSRTTVFKWKQEGRLLPGRDYIQIGRTVRYLWGPDVIRNLHQDDIREPGVQDHQLQNDTKLKTCPNKKSIINWDY